MEPREFFIEERLESYRNSCFCNLGESGFHAYRLEEIMDFANVSGEELGKLTLNDSPNRGGNELREEISKLYPGVGADEVLVTTGTSEALYLAFHLLLKKGDRLAIYWPAFQALYEIPEMLGAEILRIPVDKKLNSKDWENVDADLYVLNQPHNPTGAGFSSGDWEDLKQILRKKEKPVLFDEHYRFLDFDSDLGKTGVSTKDRFYGTGSFTKCMGVTGLRVGWLIADKEFVNRARSFKDYLTHTVSPISEKLALGLLKNRSRFLPEIKKEVKENLSFFYDSLSRLTDITEFSQVSGGLVGWAKLKRGISSEEYADLLMKKTGVFVLPGSNFEEEGFLRIGFGEKKERFREGIERWTECSPLL
ncbi:pyridoxal phosphate-dependent aminotransferase [Leptospira idonii]|uniref:Aminotransferase n=1 Tax=Leptospira idonii TaxID=1193500 RepID=A0A4R9LUL3_9LEPT|nr:pyridoxal phosphate-dependent aminotransferase [Leptospira idonii]TGN17625.1 pyridoxal phosphate-dependent aminotransferase [Leptospira idonii]